MVLESIKMKEEQDLFYSDTDEPKELGCIGHLRGDFGSDGREFWTTWHPHQSHEFNDEQFKAIFDTVINELRKPGGVLCNRADMSAYCRPQQTCRIPHPYGEQWGFRILTQDYAIYLRCMPRCGDYNFYAYCYNKRMVMTKLAKDRGLPRYSYAYLPTTQEEIRIDIAESGYIPMGKNENDGNVKKMNRESGVTPAQAKAMQVGSMFGWDVPGADPKSYDDKGKAIRKKDSREER